MISPFERYRRFKREYQLKSPKQKWLVIYSIGAKMSEMIGVTCYGDVKNYWYSYFPGLVGLTYFFTVIYTLWFYFARGDIARGLQCTCTIGIVFTVNKMNNFDVIHKSERLREKKLSFRFLQFIGKP